MTSILVFLFLLSCMLCLIITPMVRALALRCNLIDRPDGRRKLHTRATPLGGGIAIFLAVFAALAVGMLLSDNLKYFLLDPSSNLLGLLLAALVICAVGVTDDFVHLRGRHKLLGQLAAIAIVISFGLVVRHLSIFGEIELGLLAVPFTVFWLLGAINSLNLLDGMDGLLSSLGLIICLAMALMAMIMKQWATACVTMALAGALLGFLRYNFPPASIFLGDSGSMLIGLVVGVMAIRSSLKGPATIALAAPLALLTIPIFDSVAAVVRRKLTGMSIYATDRDHVHHRLLRRGLSTRGVLLWLSLSCLFTVGGALASLAFKNELYAVFTTLAVVGILVTAHLFGHGEVWLVKARLTALIDSFLTRAGEGHVRQSEVHMQGTADWKTLWNGLTLLAPQLNLRNVCLNIDAPALNERFHARWDQFDDSPDGHGSWQAEIPLVTRGLTIGRVEVKGRFDGEPVSMKIAKLENIVTNFQISGLAGARSEPETAAPALLPEQDALKATSDS